MSESTQNEEQKALKELADFLVKIVLEVIIEEGREQIA